VHDGSSRSSQADAAQMLRLVDRDRPSLGFILAGAPALAHEGDTILTAVLTARARPVEAGSVAGARTGLCLMGPGPCWWGSGEGAWGCPGGGGGNGGRAPGGALGPGGCRGEGAEGRPATPDVVVPAVAIGGAGPAGIRAAESLGRKRLPVVLIDEAPKGGGQI